LNPLAVLDGTAIQIRGNSWEQTSHVTIQEVIDINPAPRFLDDGDVEPHPRPVNLSRFGEQPTTKSLWIQWIKRHIQERNGTDRWFEQYHIKYGYRSEEKDGKVYRNWNLIINPRDKWNYEWKKNK
jgi:hypothetical protein